jgi:hypothetical protein
VESPRCVPFSSEFNRISQNSTAFPKPGPGCYLLNSDSFPDNFYGELYPGPTENGRRWRTLAISRTPSSSRRTSSA